MVGPQSHSREVDVSRLEPDATAYNKLSMGKVPVDKSKLRCEEEEARRQLESHANMKVLAEIDRQSTLRRLGLVRALQDTLDDKCDFFHFREHLWLAMREGASGLEKVHLPSERDDGPLDFWFWDAIRSDWIKKFEVEIQVMKVLAWYARILENDEETIREIEVRRTWWHNELNRIQKALGE
ncbi:hypothetical protein HDU96_003228 [Phlyctochytrium bullatum]|nr:hypothetical protein HDU96_003228 [Phlyctochytrium bullatum]